MMPVSSITFFGSDGNAGASRWISPVAGVDREASASAAHEDIVTCPSIAHRHLDRLAVFTTGVPRTE
jgi:hypothetical protein